MKVRLLLRKVKREFLWIKFYISLLMRKKDINNKVILVGEPIHGNIGDAAIAYAEYKFINNELGKEVFSIPATYIGKYTSMFKFIINSDRTLLFHGGGFIGTLWPEQAMDLQKFVRVFKNNRIIVMPQTLYFSDNECGKKAMSIMSRDFLGCKDLTICAREKYSYDLLKNYFSHIKRLLFPDMVTYLTKNHFKEPVISQQKDGVLFCLRKDKEKVDSNKIMNVLYEEINRYYRNCKIDYTDTVISTSINNSNREEVISKKMQQFSQYRLVVTDRLHGMVLAAISETPCIAITCNNYKVKGVFDWIDNNEYIKFIDKEDDVVVALQQVLNCNSLSYSNAKTTLGFSELTDLLLK